MCKCKYQSIVCYLMKHLILSLVILFAAILQAASLQVDFNGNNWGDVVVDTQAGFKAYNACNEVDDDFVANDYTAFGTTVTVVPAWSEDAVAEAKQSFCRDNSNGYAEDDPNLFSLVRDWIGTDTREIGNPLTLTISGLPEGEYTWVSYHHDTAASNMGVFDVTVNDAAGSITTTGIQISGNAITSIDGVTKFTTTIVSNGVDDVTFVFDQQRYTYEYNQAWFVLNGFEISDGNPDSIWRSGAPLRRPISEQQPMWLVHIDSWNFADPQKIIALVPEDIRPYVVMNIALSISHDEDSRFKVAEYGYEIAKSWLRACAENRMWAMIQPSSGGYSQFSDFDLSVYEELFRDYPNMIGFNYCEQFWGYDSETDPLSTAWTDRIAHFADLLELSDRYGGYLVVSWCGNQWSPNINPIAMLKRNSDFAAACEQYSDNYILCEKYTQQSYQSDMESLCLGAYLSGYSGQYGIRYDDTGWTDVNGDHDNFTMATAGAPYLEHIMLTGMTVIDGPELIWTQCFYETSTGTTSDGYSMRQWETYSQFDNVSVDLFRKILDGTVRIPTRQEVVDRTKVVIINNVDSGSNDEIYSSPETLFEGLYRMDGDGNYEDNKTFFKKTGRYPTVPTVYQLADAVADSFEIQVNKSDYANYWPDISDKVSDFNDLFVEEYAGDIYAGRHENGWVTYNPYKTGEIACGSIPFKYNTCDYMELSYSQYTAGVIKEYSDQVTFYLSNYDDELNLGMRTDTISIHGCIIEPDWSYEDRADHDTSVVTSGYSGGVFTLTVEHNGSLDITINCSGAAADRLTDYTAAVVVDPCQPMVYAGPVQYEAECFDYKYIDGVVKSGYSGSVRNYMGQGYLSFGTNSLAKIRDYVNVVKDGTYRIEARYSVVGSDVDSIKLVVNGNYVATPTFVQTATLSDWKILTHNIELNAGINAIKFAANEAGASSVYFDNIVVVPTSYGNGVTIEENGNGYVGVDGIIDDAYSGFTGAGYADTHDLTGVGIDWEMYFDPSVTKSFTFRYACPEDSTADLIVNDEIIATQIQFPSTGSWLSWDFVTVYAGSGQGQSDVRLESTSSTGLPNIDSLEVTGLAIYGDINADSIVNESDLPDFASHWLDDECNLDLDGDCIITLYEFVMFAGNWLVNSYQ